MAGILEAALMDVHTVRQSVVVLAAALAPKDPVEKMRSWKVPTEMMAVQGPAQTTPAEAYLHLEATISSCAMVDTGQHTLFFFINLLILCNTETLTCSITDMPPVNLLSSRRSCAAPEPNGTIPTGGSENMPKGMVGE